MKRLRIHLVFSVVAIVLLFTVCHAELQSQRRAESGSRGTEDRSARIVDSDGDGVPDHLDRCPGTFPGVSGVDSTGCPTEIDPFVKLKFDDKLHRAWYKRFWTGSCKDVKKASWIEGLKCKKGKRGSNKPREQFWFDTTERCLQKVPPVDRGHLRFRLWKLGRMVGNEWARANNVRSIDSGDIKRWGKVLLEANAEELDQVIEDIHKKAVSKLEGSS